MVPATDGVFALSIVTCRSSLEPSVVTSLKSLGSSKFAVTDVCNQHLAMDFGLECGLQAEHAANQADNIWVQSLLREAQNQVNSLKVCVASGSVATRTSGPTPACRRS